MRLPQTLSLYDITEIRRATESSAADAPEAVMQGSRRPQGICIFCSHLKHIPRSQQPRSRLRTFTSSTRDGVNISRVSTGEKFDGSRIRKVGKDGWRARTGDGERKGQHERSGPQRQHGFGRTPKHSFDDAFERCIRVVKTAMEKAPIMEHSGDLGSNFRKIWMTFMRKTVAQGFYNETEEHKRMMTSFRDAFRKRGVSGLEDRVKYAFYGHITGLRFTDSDIRNQTVLADLRYPTEWYPATRTMHRTIHLHVGPTNSGKTYHALKRLEAAESGMYAGPLRLLAHEVFTRLNAKGKRCTLVTGEERRYPDEAGSTTMSSCTVEMMPLNATVDVAVIDEIQMIGNNERGWAWTQALLGVKAKEVHLCGEARTVPLIRELCASIGEKLIVHEYTRLSPLEMAEGSMEGDLKRLRKGDCIVSFSVVGIHALRRQIERQTGKKVATVYGSLPPETRAAQARLFNDPNNDFDFLVASDAIGMGLNLSIKRIIFEASSKFDGYQRRPLAIADIKQIAGRAGRYRTAQQAVNNPQADESLAAVKGEPEPGNQMITAQEAVLPLEPESPADKSSQQLEQDVTKLDEGTTTSPSIIAERITPQDVSQTQREPPRASSGSLGLVTTLEKFDFPMIQSAMKAEPEPITTAGIFPPAPIVERFAQYFPPGTPFSYVMLRLHELSQMHTRFHLCGLKDQLWIADLIEPVRNLTITDRIILCACPASKQDSELFRDLLPALARCVEQQSGGNLLDIPEIPLEVLDEELSASRVYLRELERLHKAIIAYLWLSYRFAGIFSARPLAFHIKGLVEQKIEQVLGGFSFTDVERKMMQAKREQSVLQAMRTEVLLNSDMDFQGSFKRIHIPLVDEQTSVIAGGDSFSGESEEFSEEEPGSPNDPVPRSTENGDADGTHEFASQDNPFDEDASYEQDFGQASATVPTGREEMTEDSLEVPEHVDGVLLSGSEIPTKHLHHANVNATEVERDMASRP